MPDATAAHSPQLPAPVAGGDAMDGQRLHSIAPYEIQSDPSPSSSQPKSQRQGAGEPQEAGRTPLAHPPEALPVDPVSAPGAAASPAALMSETAGNEAVKGSSPEAVAAQAPLPVPSVAKEAGAARKVASVPTGVRGATAATADSPATLGGFPLSQFMRKPKRR